MRRQGPAPAVSVVIASYRWPEALSLSVASALSQSLREIEVLVVEDGPDTASRDVVRAAADARVRWLSLPENTGSQAAPNELGRSLARVPVVAYLGHDDLWTGDHLAGLIGALDRADLVHSVTLAIGPPPQQRLMVAGTRAWEPALFVPPSSIAHRRVCERIAPWPSPHSHEPVDYGLLSASRALGMRVAAVPRATVLKFPAAWRPDVYATRDVSLQLSYRARLAADPRLADGLYAAAVRAGAPPLTRPPAAASGEISDHNRRAKGLAARFGAGRVRWQPQDELQFDGWHGYEVDARGRGFRWTGAGAGDGGRAVVRLDAAPEAECAVRVVVAHWLVREQLERIEVQLDGVTAALECLHDPDGSLVVTARARRSSAREIVEVGVVAPTLVARDVVAESGDTRPLGVAVRSIEVLGCLPAAPGSMIGACSTSIAQSGQTP